MNEHTTGPWHTKAGMTQMCDDDATTVARARAHGDDGAFWWIFSPADGHGEAEADARLIAAAPELLDALQAAVEMYGKPGGPWNVPGSAGCWITQARAAIAKATGVAT